MCTQCDPYRPGFEDVSTTTVEDAARAERERAIAAGEWDDDRPDPADLARERAEQRKRTMLWADDSAWERL